MCCRLARFADRYLLTLPGLAFVLATSIAGTVFIVGSAWAVQQITGASGPTMTKAADSWLASLDAEQRAKAMKEYDDPTRLDWHFIPKPVRKGLQIREMTEPQRALAKNLLQSGLSQTGYDKATHIMAVETLLKELEAGKTGTPLRDPERYYFTLFGKPAPTGKWGLSIEGHHLSWNFVVDQNKIISSTPNMFGANPAIMKGPEKSGVKTGTRLLAKEELLAFDLLASFTPEQKAIAVFAKEALSEVRAAGTPQPPAEKAVGLSAEKMSAPQRETLKALIEVYIGSLADDLAKERLAEVEKAGIQNVYFGWAGAEQPGIGHYYRVQGTTFVIEFVNTQPDAAGNPANHIHCTWRDLRGDFAIPIQ